MFENIGPTEDDGMRSVRSRAKCGRICGGKHLERGRLACTDELDHVILAPLEQKLVDPTLASEAERSGQDRVQPRLVETLVSRRPHDPCDHGPRAAAVELPTGIQPAGGTGGAHRDELSISSHRVDQERIDREPGCEPGCRKTVLVRGRAHRLSLRQLRSERLPGRGVPATRVARHDPSLRVDHEDVWLVGRTEAPRAVAMRVGDRRPAPPVPLDERSALVRRVCDVEAEKCELRVTLLELCVGDRLALAGASPRRPDVHEHLLAAEVGKGGLLSVERRSRDRWGGRACRCFSGSRRLCDRRICDRRRSRRGSLVVRAASAPGDKEGADTQQEHESPHQVNVASMSLGALSFRIS